MGGGGCDGLRYRSALDSPLMFRGARPIRHDTKQTHDYYILYLKHCAPYISILTNP